MNMRRMRGRGNRNGGGSFRSPQTGIPLNRNHVFDSNGPEQRARGTAQQLYDKYTQLGRDASSSGDRVLAESYFQYAEHYFRIVGAMTQAQSQRAEQHGDQRPQQRTEQPAESQAAPEEAAQPEPEPEPQPQPQAQPKRSPQRQSRGANGHGRRRSTAAATTSVEEAIEAELSGNPPGLGEQPSVDQRDIPIGVAPPEA